MQVNRGGGLEHGRGEEEDTRRRRKRTLKIATTWWVCAGRVGHDWRRPCRCRSRLGGRTGTYFAKKVEVTQLPIWFHPAEQHVDEVQPVQRSGSKSGRSGNKWVRPSDEDLDFQFSRNCRSLCVPL